MMLLYNHTLCLAESAHTTGVGTFVYAAPEQLKGSHYDSKVNKNITAETLVIENGIKHQSYKIPVKHILNF